MEEKLTIDDLAVMILNGFETAKNESNDQFKEVKDRLDKLELRQDNVAYKFEINELEQRVTVLENKECK